MRHTHDTEWITITALGDIGLVLAVAVVFVLIARRLRQPAVVGEILAGICLGPSLLGLLPHDLPALLFPVEIRSHLTVVANVGLLLFMFVLGWEFTPRTLNGRYRTVGTLWLVAVVVPMTLGFGLAAGLFASPGTVGRPGTRLFDFMLFIGTAMAISAFPVMARIITDLRLRSTPVGRLALTLAALDDVLAWCLLAVIVALVNASGPGDFLQVVGWGLAYGAVMWTVVRPVLARLFRPGRNNTLVLTTMAATGVLGSAYVTATIGLHPILGAFVFGLVMPRGTGEAGLHAAVRVPLENLARLLLPVYFVVTGLSMDLTALGRTGAVYIAVVLLVACVGKAGGVLLASRLVGTPFAQGFSLGVLMNTRGLTGLVILNTGLQLGLLSVQLFTAMTVAALLTTALTSPLLDAVVARTQGDAALGGPRDTDDGSVTLAQTPHGPPPQPVLHEDGRPTTPAR
jgi:Kef-type K+ transport system membrane component KefB